MSSSEQQRLLRLTPEQEVAAEERAYNAFIRQKQLEQVEAAGEESEVARTPAVIRQFLIDLIAMTPVLGVVMIFFGLLLSADKTYSIFSQSALAGGGAWRVAMGIAAVAVIDLGMVYAGFAKRVEMIRRGGERRRVVTLASVLRGIAVRLGFVPVLRRRPGREGWYVDVIRPDSQEAADDANLIRMGGFLFVLGVLVNVSAYVLPQLHAYELAAAEGGAMQLSLSEWLYLGLYICIGAVAPFVLDTGGEQLAIYGHRFYLHNQQAALRQQHEAFMVSVRQEWEAVREALVAREQHRSYLNKNRLPEGSGSPYLLVAGEGVQEGELVAVDFPSSSAPLRTPPGKLH